MRNNLPYDIEKIKQSVSMDQIVSLSESIDTSHKVKCLWHDDHHPSFHVYKTGGKCYACGVHADIFSWIMKKEGLSFLQSVKWIADREGILPEKFITSTSTDYRGPVPSAWITYWHEQLTEDRREYLHNRLLTDETIDSHMLGYDPEKSAFVIPFYTGYPKHNSIEIFQYRAAPWKVWDDSRKEKRYWGKQGYNRPAVLGQHLINPEMVIILFGTIDQLLAEQDGLPAISLSAIEGFKNPEDEWVVGLKKALANTKNIIVIPDGTLSEFSAGQKLADHLGGIVKYFPKDCDAKDYNEYRLAGHTAKEFIEEILQMPQYMYLIDQDHIGRTFDILDLIGEGNGDGAFTILQCMVADSKYAVGAVSHALQMSMTRKPPTGTLDDIDWVRMSEEFYQCISYPELAGVIKRYSDLANTRMGAF